MARRFLLLFAIALTGLTLVAAGCGGDDEESAAEDVPALTETTEETTTEEEATEEETTTEEEATEESSDSGVTSAEDCEEFAQVGSKISEALTGTSDVGEIQSAFDELAAAAPDEIKDDFETLSEFFGTVADAGTDPTALQSLDTTAATEASQNIATWATENCGAAATP